jgi:hypothetical protein
MRHCGIASPHRHHRHVLHRLTHPLGADDTAAGRAHHIRAGKQSCSLRRQLPEVVAHRCVNDEQITGTGFFTSDLQTLGERAT